MTFSYVSRKCTVREDTKAYTEKKLKKLEKFFGEDCVLHCVFTCERSDRFTVEVTASEGGLIFRAQETASDFKYCIDAILDTLIRQIRKHRTKLEKRLKNSDFSSILPVDEEPAEPAGNVVRTKRLTAAPMTADEAVLQMDLLGHDFFIFRNPDGAVCVAYRRRDGAYGVIETE